ncbi:hypothetical protein J0X19_22430 [Hymenobacter sp. BT186]|uniref:Uncharacterized protein n=1 Tax=Hymenobacter telluris TaxID=2816474 RepID=A0A939F074_9BACT|nr:hypothetical protein [Hymenobacter telluris]MBO0360735.1 hypothetical protein [Hymenobacter telluris]MBW3376763.1 hypothetical protein [Hymenobacter norwichensis]
MSNSSKPPKKSTKSASTGERTTIAVEPGVRKLLATAAKETKHTHMEYASAAIRYFAERGLDPVVNNEREGAVIQKRIGDVEQLVVSLGNRLFGWLTQHEKNLNKDLFGFLRSHEKALFDYLQVQEQNVHEHLNDQEQYLLHPIIRELMLTNVEALYGRRLGEQIILKVLGREQTEYPAKHKEFNERRDNDARNKQDRFFDALFKTGTPLSTIPQPTPLPVKAHPAPNMPPPAATDEP